VAEAEAMAEGMAQKSKEFMAGGGEIYIPIRSVS
jgi:phosphomethylpyrimidine synthase